MPALYPRQSNLSEQIMTLDIQKKMILTPEEEKACGLVRLEDNRLQWKDDIGTDFELSDAEINFLKDQCTRLDKEKVVTIQLVNLCKKIKEIDLTVKK
jgi:hypothetical protein